MGHRNIAVQCQNRDCPKQPEYVTSWAAFNRRSNKCPVCKQSKARELDQGDDDGER